MVDADEDAVVVTVDEIVDVCVVVCVVTSQSKNPPFACVAIAPFNTATVVLQAPCLAATRPSFPQVTRSSSPFGPENSSSRCDNLLVQSP